MTGIIIAAIAGVILSFVDAGKKILAAQFQPEVVILMMNSFGVVCTLVYFALVGFPPVDWPQILLPFVVCGFLGVFGEIFILKALKEADFSLTMPLMAFIPVFGALLGFLLFAEFMTYTLTRNVLRRRHRLRFTNHVSVHAGPDSYRPPAGALVYL